MSHKRHHALRDTDTGEIFNVYCDALPLGRHEYDTTLVTHKQKTNARSIFYDPHDWNSVQAMIDYTSVHQGALENVWRYLFDNNGHWIDGSILVEPQFGTAGLERLRELRYKYGWPIESRSPGKPGTWLYRLNLRPPRKRMRKR